MTRRWGRSPRSRRRMSNLHVDLWKGSVTTGETNVTDVEKGVDNVPSAGTVSIY